MAEEQNPQSSTEDTDSGKPEDNKGESQEEQSSGADTLEDVEAYWRKRQSNTDKAHEAERRVLQQRLEALEAQSKASGTESASSGDTEAQRKVMAELAKRVEQAEGRAKAAELKSQYPLAVEAVGQAATSMDEARLAALNEQLNFDARKPTRIDNNNPSRSVTGGAKPIDDMSIEELQNHLKSLPYNSGQ